MASIDEYLFNPSRLRDPYQYFDEIRRRGSVQWSDYLNGWAVIDLPAVREVSKHKDVGQGDRTGAQLRNLAPDVAKALAPISEHMPRALSSLDPPEHAMQRAAATSVIDAKLTRMLGPDVQATVDDLLAGIQARGSFDGKVDFALPLTTSMMSRIVGVRLEDRDEFVEWVECVFRFLGSDQTDPEMALECKRAYVAMGEYVQELIQHERRSPTTQHPESTLIPRLVSSQREMDRTDDDLIGMLVGLVQGGFETTTSLISSMISLLMLHPDQRARLQVDPSLLDSAIEETLRYESSLKFGQRQAHTDLVVDGHPVARGDVLAPILSLANRDPNVFERPHTFDIGRKPNPHVAFGFGTHFCIGAPLARLQARIGVGALLERFPNMSLEAGDVSWRPSFLLRQVEAVPLTVGTLMNA